MTHCANCDPKEFVAYGTCPMCGNKDHPPLEEVMSPKEAEWFRERFKNKSIEKLNNISGKPKP